MTSMMTDAIKRKFLTPTVPGSIPKDETCTPSTINLRPSSRGSPMIKTMPSGVMTSIVTTDVSVISSMSANEMSARVQIVYANDLSFKNGTARCARVPVEFAIKKPRRETSGPCICVVDETVDAYSAAIEGVSVAAGSPVPVCAS